MQSAASQRARDLAADLRARAAEHVGTPYGAQLLAEARRLENYGLCGITCGTDHVRVSW